MWTKAFWADAGTRAIRTVAQTAVALLTALGIGTVASVGLLDIDWRTLGSVSLGAGLLSVLTSISGGVKANLAEPEVVDTTPVEDAGSPDVYDPNLEAGPLPDPAQAE